MIQNSKFKIQNSGGFTLIEFLIVIAITIAVSTITVIGLGRYKGIKDLERASDELLAVIQATQKRSITQESGKSWGIRFVNPASGSDYYEVFKGLSYASGAVDKTHYFRRGVSFLNPGVSTTIDVIFKAIKGWPNQSQVISFSTDRRDGYLGDIIVNASSGRSFYRQEQGLQGYWHLDENTSTTTYDASGNNNTGVLTSSPTWQSGSNCKAGACLNFTSNNVDFSNSTVGNTLTLTAWLKSSAYDGKIPLSLDGSSFGSGPNVYFSCGVINWNTGDSCSNSFSGSSYPDSNWHYFVIVDDFSANSAKLYLDGAYVGSASYKDPAMSGNVFRIGAWHGGGYNFNGSIDEIRFYNRALSATEISNQYNDLR